MELSRRQRAVAASFTMIAVTIFSLVFVFHGEPRSGLSLETFSALISSAWVYRGKDDDEWHL
jgi:hypothetical protein